MNRNLIVAIYPTFFLILFIPVTNTLNLCQPQSDVSSYKYRNESVQNCNCTTNFSNCIRKCCALGFYASKGMCFRYNNSNERAFNVPVYRNRKFVRNVSEKDGIVVGVMQNCSFFPLEPEKHPDKDRMFVQENGGLVTGEYGFVENDVFCVDEIMGIGFSAFMCYSNEEEKITLRRVNAGGIFGAVEKSPFYLGKT